MKNKKPKEFKKLKQTALQIFNSLPIFTNKDGIKYKLVPSCVSDELLKEAHKKNKKH